MFARTLSRYLAAGLTALTLAGGSAAATAAPQPARTVAIAAQNRLEVEILAQLNVVRAQHKLPALRLAPSLSRGADLHSKNMARGGFFAHENADGSAFWKRVQRFYGKGSYRSWSVGENLLWSAGTLDAAGAVKLWMASPPHRKNILDRTWREIGLSAIAAAAAPGVYAGRDVVIVTTDFGARS
jgi:uncharacterized protein YkwD